MGNAPRKFPDNGDGTPSRLNFYDDLIARMMDKDRNKRATIEEVC
jgi:hypothetical protein